MKTEMYAWDLPAELVKILKQTSLNTKALMNPGQYQTVKVDTYTKQIDVDENAGYSEMSCRLCATDGYALVFIYLDSKAMSMVGIDDAGLYRWYAQTAEGVSLLTRLDTQATPPVFPPRVDNFEPEPSPDDVKGTCVWRPSLGHYEAQGETISFNVNLLPKIGETWHGCYTDSKHYFLNTDTMGSSNRKTLRGPVPVRILFRFMGMEDAATRQQKQAEIDRRRSTKFK